MRGLGIKTTCWVYEQKLLVGFRNENYLLGLGKKLIGVGLKKKNICV